MLGAAGTVVLAGLLALAFALSRRPEWSVLSSLAGGVLLSVAVTALGLTVAAAVVDGPLTQTTAWLVLVMPLVVAGAALSPSSGARTRRDPTTPDDSGAQTFLLPLAVAGLAVLAAALAVDVVNDGFGAAWAMSGDNRNHINLARAVVADGGLTVEGLRSYPVLWNALVAVHAVAGSRPGAASPGALLEHDVTSLAALYVLTAALTTVMVAAAAAQLVGRRRGALAAGGSGGHLVALGAGLLVLSPLVMGTALADGYFTGVGGLLLLVCAMITATQALERRSCEATAVTGGAALMLLVVWPPLALVAAPLSVLASVGLLTGTRTVRSKLAAGVGLVLGLVPFAVFTATRSTLGAALLLEGSITRPSVLVLVVLIVVLLLARVRGTGSASGLLVAAVVAGTGTLLVAVLATLGAQTSWTYYASKTLWLVESGLLFVALLPAAWVGLTAGRDTDRRSLIRRGTTTAALVVAATAVTGMATSLGPPLARAAIGWDQPSSVTASAVMSAGDEQVPYVFWRWSEPGAFTGEDRLANFWSIAVWGRTPDGTNSYPDAVPNGPLAWAYTAGTTADLCALAQGVPGLRIHTRDAALSAELAAGCPGTAVDVILAPRA